MGSNEAGDIVVAAAHGYYVADEALVSWRERDAVQAHWATQENTPPALHARLVSAYRGKGLSMERVLLDLHSGRILGSRGELFMDGIAILFLLLASTGIWLWAKRKR